MNVNIKICFCDIVYSHTSNFSVTSGDRAANFDLHLALLRDTPAVTPRTSVFTVSSERPALTFHKNGIQTSDVRRRSNHYATRAASLKYKLFKSMCAHRIEIFIVNPKKKKI
jgi:hypothetical protein